MATVEEQQAVEAVEEHQLSLLVLLAETIPQQRLPRIRSSVQSASGLLFLD